MAKPKRVTRKQLLKEPDEFITTTGRIIQWGQRYARQLTFAGGVFIVLLATVTAYRYYDNWVENKAFRLLSEAVSKYETEKTASGVMQAHQSAREDFEYIIRKFGNTEGGRIAAVVFAGISYDAGDADRSVDLYEAGLKAFDDDAAYRNILWSSLGYAYEKKQDIGKAVDCFRQIADSQDPTVKDLALFNLGRLYEQMGDAAKSQAAFRRLTSEHTDSMYYQLAREKVKG